ncbi:MAG TPA: glutaredoxin domain-containing protein [Nitrosomonas sp.]|nr:glutaredoxin domain-containing protein [Nitrosomonas sp.]
MPTVITKYLAILLALCVGYGALRQKPAQAAPADIEIYTASYCSECKRAKAYLRKNGIAYDEYDIEKDIERRREFYARGGKAIPYLFVHGQPMHGFNIEQFERLRRQSN